MTDTARHGQPAVISLEPLPPAEADNVGAIDCLTDAIQDLARSSTGIDASDQASLNAQAFDRIMGALTALTARRVESS